MLDTDFYFSADNLLERAGRARKACRVPTRLGIDEKTAAKGHRHLTLEHRERRAARDEPLTGSRYLCGGLDLYPVNHEIPG